MLSARPYLPRAAENGEYAQTRLRGTVWARVASAHRLYGGLMDFGRWIGRMGVSANALTYLSLALAGVAGVVAASGQFAWAAVALLASGACDLFDGVVARATDTVSAYGALLDSTVDRLADALPLLGLAFFYRESAPSFGIPALALLGAFTVSYVRARAEALGATLPPLFMRRPERVILLTLTLFLGGVELEVARAPLLLLALSLIATLNFAAAVAALRAARRNLTDAARTTGSRPAL